MNTLLLQANKYFSQSENGANSFFRYLASAFVFLFFLLILSPIPLVVLGVYISVDSSPDTYIDLENAVQPFICPTYMFLLAVGAVFAIIALSLLLIVKFIHKRSITSLFTALPKISITRILHGAAVWVVLISLVMLIEYFTRPGEFVWTFDASTFGWLFIGALLSIPIQAGTEELFFRGYLNQSLFVLCKEPIIPVIITSVAFAVAHFWNPEMSNEDILSEKMFIALNYLVFALLASIVSLRDNSLELAMGIHIANNMFSVLCINYADSPIPSDSLLTLQNIAPLFDLIAVVVISILFYVYFFVCLPLCRPAKPMTS